MLRLLPAQPGEVQPTGNFLSSRLHAEAVGAGNIQGSLFIDIPGVQLHQKTWDKANTGLELHHALSKTDDSFLSGKSGVTQRSPSLP